MTISEVARRAGVSKATVSRALNAPHMVTPQTRERIMTVIREMNYTPNPFAQGLNTGRTSLIALVVANLTNPYFAQVAEGCDDELRHMGYHLIITNTYQNPVLEVQALQAVGKRRVAGVILGGLQDPNGLEGALPSGVPLTIIGQTPKVNLLYDSVMMDDFTGLLESVRHLAARGYRELACIAGPPDHPITVRRLKILREVAGAQELRLKVPVHGEFQSIDSGRKAMRELLSSAGRPRAVMAMNDILAVGALRATLESGLSVPNDIAIMGFDDIPLASYTWPSLTTVHSDNVEIGRQAARCIVNRIRQPKARRQSVIVPARLVVRDSC